MIRGFDPQHCQNRSLGSKFLDVPESQIHPALPKQISQPSQAPLLFFLFVLYQYIFCTKDTTSQLWKSDSALLHGWNTSKRPHTEMPTQARKGITNFEGREERALGSRFWDGRRSSLGWENGQKYVVTLRTRGSRWSFYIQGSEHLSRGRPSITS